MGSTQQEWLKVLGKGMITLPKKWREALGLQEGGIVKAGLVGTKIVIESPRAQYAPYRVFSDDEIDAFLEEDKVPRALVEKARKDLTHVSS